MIILGFLIVGIGVACIVKGVKDAKK